MPEEHYPSHLAPGVQEEILDAVEEDDPSQGYLRDLVLSMSAMAMLVVDGDPACERVRIEDPPDVRRGETDRTGHPWTEREHNCLVELYCQKDFFGGRFTFSPGAMLQRSEHEVENYIFANIDDFDRAYAQYNADPDNPKKLYEAAQKNLASALIHVMFGFQQDRHDQGR